MDTPEVPEVADDAAGDPGAADLQRGGGSKGDGRLEIVITVVVSAANQMLRISHR